MAKEISDFDGWLQTVQATTESLGLIDSLNVVAWLMSDKFGVRVWFVEILGRRWSYLAGKMPEQCPESAIERIELEKHIGLASDSWGKLSVDNQTKLVEFLNMLISERLVASEL